jgi:hypothetical protein
LNIDHQVFVDDIVVYIRVEKDVIAIYEIEKFAMKALLFDVGAYN